MAIVTCHAAEEIARLIPHGRVQKQEPLAAHTSFRIGGPCAVLAVPGTEEELAALLSYTMEKGLPRFLLGSGTNLLCADRGYDGVVIQTGCLNGVAVEDDLVAAGAGASLTKTAFAAMNASLTGLEFAHGIPGSAGGGAVMNAGAYGGELGQVISDVTCLDGRGNRRTVPAEAAGFAYRTSIFQRSALTVTSIRCRLKPGDPAEIRACMADLAERRREKQPLDLPSAGSVFKRPAAGYASAMIDACGLKGCAVGGACVSEKHAGFIVNRGGATCADVLALIEIIQQCVKERFGVLLECEIQTLGL